MDPDGRKIVTVRSAIILTNKLPYPMVLKMSYQALTRSSQTKTIETEQTIAIPLIYANGNAQIAPTGNSSVSTQTIDWRQSTLAGNSVHQVFKFDLPAKDQFYW